MIPTSTWIPEHAGGTRCLATLAALEDGMERPGQPRQSCSAAALRIQSCGTRSKRPQHVSSGVMAGYLIHKVVPDYPPIATTMHLEGTVVLAGHHLAAAERIENLRVVSGPALLQQAALDAVGSGATGRTC